MHLAELLRLRRAALANRYPDHFSSRFVLDHYYLVCRLIAGHIEKENDQ
jgi:hypothetical protein